MPAVDYWAHTDLFEVQRFVDFSLPPGWYSTEARLQELRRLVAKQQAELEVRERRANDLLAAIAPSVIQTPRLGPCAVVPTSGGRVAYISAYGVNVARPKPKLRWPNFPSMSFLGDDEFSHGDTLVSGYCVGTEASSYAAADRVAATTLALLADEKDFFRIARRRTPYSDLPPFPQEQA